MIEARYGWTDEGVLSLPYARFLQVAEQAAKGQKEDVRRLAFLGWQVQAPFGDKQIGFNEYLTALGLGDEKPALWVTKEQAAKRAEEILRMFGQSPTSVTANPSS